MNVLNRHIDNFDFLNTPLVLNDSNSFRLAQRFFLHRAFYVELNLITPLNFDSIDRAVVFRSIGVISDSKIGRSVNSIFSQRENDLLVMPKIFETNNLFPRRSTSVLNF